MRFPIEISVVMTVCNTAVPILSEAVQSILDQTFRAFEFIVVDDGSDGETADFLTGLEGKDERIRMIRNKSNLGITRSLNIGMDAARGKYIARMDSDDVSLPERFERQYSFMESHPDVILCGSRVQYFGTNHGTSSGKWRRKIENMDDYRIRLMFDNPGPRHPTVFMRHEDLIRNHIRYDERLIFAQDYGLFAVVSRYGKVVTLDDILVRYRMHGQQVSVTKKAMQEKCARLVRGGLLSELMEISEEDLDRHCLYSFYHPNEKITPEAMEWYGRILAANDRRRIYNGRKLKRHIERIERRLIAHTFTEEMSFADKARFAARYVSFASLLKMVVEKRIGCYD